jgi:hypothetical protein
LLCDFGTVLTELYLLWDCGTVLTELYLLCDFGFCSDSCICCVILDSVLTELYLLCDFGTVLTELYLLCFILLITAIIIYLSYRWSKLLFFYFS